MLLTSNRIGFSECLRLNLSHDKLRRVRVLISDQTSSRYVGDVSVLCKRPESPYVNVRVDGGSYQVPFLKCSRRDTDFCFLCVEITQTQGSFWPLRSHHSGDDIKKERMECVVECSPSEHY